MPVPTHIRLVVPRLATVLLLVACGLGPKPLSGQSPGYAEVRGRVEDSAGLPASGVHVTLRDAQGTVLRERASARDGTFRFAYLEPGTFQLRVEDTRYRPVLVTGLDLRRGSELALDVVLESAPTTIDAPATRRVAPSRVVGGGTPTEVQVERLDRLPFPTADAADLHLEHTRASAGSNEGLPLHALQLRLAGMGTAAVLHGAAGHPLGLPIGALTDAAWRALPDVEFDAPAGVALDLGLRRGDSSGARAEGRLARPGLLDADREEDRTDAWVLGTYGASWSRGAGLTAGVGWRRQAASGWPSQAVREASAAVADAAGRYGLSLNPDGAPVDDAITLFGRADVPLGRDGHVRGQFVLSDQSVSHPAGPIATADARGDRRLAMLTVDASSRVSGHIRSESRIGLSRVEDTASGEPGQTTLGILSLGERELKDERVAISAAQSFHVDQAAHRLKAGASLDLLRIEAVVDPLPGPEFSFADAATFAAARGLYAGSPDVATATALMPRYALFAQDVWQVTPALRLLTGARLVMDVLPAADIDLEERWYFATGMANTAMDRWMVNVEPRVGLEWSGGRTKDTRAYAAAGLYHDRVDPAAMVEFIGNDGTLALRRVGGDLDQWPVAPTGGAAASGLSVPGANLRVPRTLRVHGGVVRRYATGTVGIEVVGRQTDRLLVRRDGNRRAAPWGTDQYGRVIWAPPVAVDGLLAATEGWRAVPGFDHVWVLEAEGESSFYGATAFASIAPSDGLLVNGSYTLSRTRDSWPGPRAGAGSAPPPGLGDAAVDAAWMDGVSDYDIPHRALVEGVVALPIRTRPIATIRYRIESGRPFTPGYLRPLDYNADGLPGDPAHIDTELPGMAPLLAEWDCLREYGGSVAARNSCRLDTVHALDASLHLTVLGNRATLMLEALDLLASRSGLIDAALYHLDRTREPVISGSNVAIPLTVNPQFGSDLVDSSVATLRLGLRLTF